MKRNIPKRILALVFTASILAALVMNLRTGAVLTLAGGREEALPDPETASGGDTASEKTPEKETGKTPSSGETETEKESVPGEQVFVDLNGAMAEKLGMKGIYSDLDLYVTDSGYIVKAYPYTSTDYEFEQVLSLKEFLDRNGISFLYVNEPTKYLEDDTLMAEFGAQTYVNDNADRFLERLEGAGVRVLDLRKALIEDGMDIGEMYYKTDHHWNVPTALWGASRIAGALNEDLGYEIDLSLYDPAAFTKRIWEKCWLGEQGRKIGKSYVGLDDYTEMWPTYETSFTFLDDGKVWEGDFMDFINEKVYNTEADVYTTRSWHYSYDDNHVINHKQEKGSVLVIGDSFMAPCEPFLSLGLHETDSICLRNEKDSFDLRSYILDSGCDTVILAYVETMIGSRDDPDNANYMMFDLN